jgi:hypothetical protein
MTPDEKKSKALEVAALYTALANGKTLQFDTGPNQQRMNRWEDIPEELSLSIHSDISRWRVKPEPRRMWRVDNTIWETKSKKIADEWNAKGLIATEWLEVLP